MATEAAEDSASRGPSAASSYRWIVLAVAVLVHATAVALVVESISPLKGAIAPDLGTTWETAVLVYSAVLFGLIFTQLPGGALGDRYPLRYVVGIGAAIAGAATASRFAVSSLTGQIAVSVVVAVGIGLVNPNLVAVITDWFPEDQLGLGQGILLSGYSIGAGAALSLSAETVLPAVGSWERVFLLYGGLTVGASVLWLLVVRRSPPQGGSSSAETGTDGPATDSGDSLREAVTAVIGAPSTKWAVATSGLAFTAFFWLLAILPEFADRQPYSVPEAYLGVPLFVSLFGSLTVPVASDRVGRAPALYGGLLGLAAGVGIAGFAPSLAAFVVGIALAGFFGGGLNAMFYVLPGALADIDDAHVGTMSGVIFSLSYVGSVISTAASGHLLTSYGVRASAVLVSLPLLLGLYCVTNLRLTDTGTAEAVDGPVAHPTERDD